MLMSFLLSLLIVSYFLLLLFFSEQYRKRVEEERGDWEKWGKSEQLVQAVSGFRSSSSPSPLSSLWVYVKYMLNDFNINHQVEWSEWEAFFLIAQKFLFIFTKHESFSAAVDSEQRWGMCEVVIKM